MVNVRRTDQRTTEWIEKAPIEYHDRQFKAPYRSTVVFCDWLEKIGYISHDDSLTILDVGCGGGANIYYMGKRYPGCRFIGLDINPDIVMNGNKFLQERGLENCHLESGDIYELDGKFVSAVDGIVSFQTLSWLPEFREPITAISTLSAKWIALTSLFYDGPASATIELQDYDETLLPQRASFYNIYSLPIFRNFLLELGYSGFQSTPFEIDVDLPKPNTNRIGTYTEKMQNGRRLQISGPLLMPWHFIAAERP